MSSSNYTPTDAVLTTAEVAEESGYSIEHVRDAVRSGELRAFQPGGQKGRIRIPRSEMQKWLTRPAAKPVEALADIDWETPAEGADPNQDFVVCDAYTDYISVHVSRMGEFYEIKTRQGR